MNISAKLKVSASKSATSPSCKTLAETRELHKPPKKYCKKEHSHFKIIIFASMKIFWLLFSILILTLSVLPCGDTVECNDKTKTEITEKDNHKNHNHSSELCPPFCNCACCGVQLANFETQLISFKENNLFEFQKENISFYESIYFQKIADKIWQPPKIS